ncbi:sugar/nucleoside kinase (ribokinase family) [Halarchaeum solikamskense]|uniref:PfkB family carbohydrate kinase n=1 Tax=Halarchaeum nitratireducens TaxID=489913 RepID=UPI001B3B194B|nr:PfkB family carbohydrate kinase [Halarchaeum solikamskense]MBP2250808.1 sugar/nucleoside kinase (ribokinase family) [Halarchaeum solikamskense]
MEDISNALAREAAVSVTCLPDGSVDRRYAVEDAAGDVETRRDLGRRIAAGHAKSFRVEHEGTAPGGQAVNAARQLHALGATTTLYGHLGHAVFDGLPFAAHSMGRPADVAVFEFDDDAVMFTEESSAIADWDLDDLDAVAGGDPFDADAVVWTNWASTGNGTAALRALAERDRAAEDGTADEGATRGRDRRWLVVDPGDVTACERDAVGPFLDALAALDPFDVALSINDDELAFLADSIDGGTDAARGSVAGTDVRAARLEFVRERGSLDLAVVHAADAAVARDASGTTRCPNLTVDARRYTGGGDRFSAGLAYALAADWTLGEALTLANACATFYVSHAETAGTERLAAWLAERDAGV